MRPAPGRVRTGHDGPAVRDHEAAGERYHPAARLDNRVGDDYAAHGHDHDGAMQVVGDEPMYFRTRRLNATGGKGFEGARSIPSPVAMCGHCVGWLLPAISPQRAPSAAGLRASRVAATRAGGPADRRAWWLQGRPAGSAARTTRVRGRSYDFMPDAAVDGTESSFGASFARGSSRTLARPATAGAEAGFTLTGCRMSRAGRRAMRSQPAPTLLARCTSAAGDGDERRAGSALVGLGLVGTSGSIARTTPHGPSADGLGGPADSQKQGAYIAVSPRRCCREGEG